MMELERENWVVKIQDNTTGEVATYIDEFGSPDSDPFMWEDGNYSCDCNRLLFFHRGQGMPEDQVRELDLICGHERFTVLEIVDAKGRRIYSEEKTE